MSYNPPSQPPPWGQPPQPGPTPYIAPAPPESRPKWMRKRILLPVGGALFFLGVMVGVSDDPAQAEKAASVKAAPAATVTATTTETAEPEPAATKTVTAKPKPAPTVTKTKTVRVTVAPAVDDSDDSSSSTGGSTGGGSTYYANCSAVRAAGAAPIRTGDPGYGSHLDRDGDGVACE